MRAVLLFSFLFIYTWAISQVNNSLTRKEEKFVDKVLLTVSSAEQLLVPVLDSSFAGLYKDGDRVFILKNQGELLGYLLSTRALGRYDYFDYSILYSPDVSVLGLTVTTYRSSHGAAICQRKWLGQFEGYRGEELSLGNQIDGISGATISATALLIDMKRNHQLIGHLKDTGLSQ